MSIIEQARPADWSCALELAFAPLPEPERQRHIVNGLALLAGRELAAEGVWIARSAGDVVGVQICELLGGAACLFWLPTVQDDLEPSLPERLVHAGLDWCRQRGCKLAEALVAPDALARAAPLCAAGFRRVTELHSLRHDLYEVPGPPGLALRYEPWSEASRSLFEQTLLRTYEGTLDCPELNGVRTVAEILAGHRAAGKDRPDLWWLAFQAGRPVGVLLLTELPHGLDWELSYVGVIPEARGKGLGHVLTQRALEVARREGALHLLLAVDGRNEPARSLYRRNGFAEVERRVVYLYFFSQSRPTSEPEA
jgi:ribosomal protein S18 acetylase RimI-like enzyme